MARRCAGPQEAAQPHGGWNRNGLAPPTSPPTFIGGEPRGSLGAADTAGGDGASGIDVALDAESEASGRSRGLSAITDRRRGGQRGPHATSTGCRRLFGGLYRL